MKKLDLHVHTRFSRDSSLNLKLLARLIKKLNLYLAITDHNTIGGAVVFRKRFKDLRSRVIVGEEVKTLQGEVIGLLLQEEVKPFRDVFETVDEVRSQGGLVLVPHSFNQFHTFRNNTVCGVILVKHNNLLTNNYLKTHVPLHDNDGGKKRLDSNTSF